MSGQQPNLRADAKSSSEGIIVTVLLLAAVLLSACERPDAPPSALGELKLNAPSHMQLVYLVGYDQDISEESKGVPVQKANASWAEFWLGIMSSLESGAATKSDADDNHKYIRYIVACRHVAGLPDLPNHPSDGVSTPGGCNVSGVVAAEAESAAHPGQSRKSGDWMVWSSKQSAHP